MDDVRFTVPLYTATTAARHLGISVNRLRYWANKDKLLTAISDTKRGANLPFIALVEAQLYCVFRNGNLSWQAITSGMQKVRAELGDDMFAEGRLAYDMTGILMNLAETSMAPEWIRARDLQTTIPRIVEEGLRLITWDDQHYPQAIKLTVYGDADIVADYRYAFGQPVIKGTRTRVDDVIHLFRAGETLKTICEEFMVEGNIAESIIRAHVANAA